MSNPIAEGGSAIRKWWPLMLPIAYLLHLVEEWFGGEGFASWTTRALNAPVSPTRFIVLNSIVWPLFALLTVLAMRRPGAAWFLMMFGWLIYALGRFLLGAWVGRKGWIQNASQYLPGFRRVMRIALPLGLLLEGIWRLILYYSRTGRLPQWEHWSVVAGVIHQFSMPLLATGYLCAIVVGLHHPRARPFLAPFGHVGRMALSNYVAQSFVIAFVMFGVGPGLALAGRIGVSWQVVIVTAAFAAQVIVSRWWLGRFRFGPLEWVWRGLTYGAWPAFRRDKGKRSGTVSDPAA